MLRCRLRVLLLLWGWPRLWLLMLLRWGRRSRLLLGCGARLWLRRGA